PSSGTISGMPSATGAFPFVARLTDSGQPAQTITQGLSITVNQQLRVTTQSLPAGTPGTPYSATLSASGGTQPFAWSIASGTFPPGLLLTASNGAISGTPTMQGTFSFTARVTDNGDPQQQASQFFSVSIAP